MSRGFKQIHARTEMCGILVFRNARMGERTHPRCGRLTPALSRVGKRTRPNAPSKREALKAHSYQPAHALPARPVACVRVCDRIIGMWARRREVSESRCRSSSAHSPSRYKRFQLNSCNARRTWSVQRNGVCVLCRMFSNATVGHAHSVAPRQI